MHSIDDYEPSQLPAPPKPDDTPIKLDGLPPDELDADDEADYEALDGDE